MSRPSQDHLGHFPHLVVIVDHDHARRYSG
jgi:hypothetical protein